MTGLRMRIRLEHLSPASVVMAEIGIGLLLRLYGILVSCMKTETAMAIHKVYISKFSS